MTKIGDMKRFSIFGISEVLRIQPQIQGDIRTCSDITKLGEIWLGKNQIIEVEEL